MHDLTRTLAAVVIAAYPTLGLAQTKSTAAAQPNPAAEHLAAARGALNKVLNAPAPSGDAFKKLSQVKTEYIALEKAASAASPEWAGHYATIDRLVTELVGESAPSGEPGAVGTSGRAGAQPAKGLDPAIAANLQEFRTHLTAFSTAMSAVAPSASGTTGATAARSAPAAAAPAPSAPTPSSAAPAPAPPSTPAPPPATSEPPKATPIPAPPAPNSAAAVSPSAPSTPAPTTTTPATAATPSPSSSAAPTTTPTSTADASVAGQLDQVTALIDAALAANAADASGKVSIDRAILEQIKAQLGQIKAGGKKQ